MQKKKKSLLSKDIIRKETLLTFLDERPQQRGCRQEAKQFAVPRVNVLLMHY